MTIFSVFRFIAGVTMREKKGGALQKLKKRLSHSFGRLCKLWLFYRPLNLLYLSSLSPPQSINFQSKSLYLLHFSFGSSKTDNRESASQQAIALGKYLLINWKKILSV
jgi:hypothetical protein